VREPPKGIVVFSGKDGKNTKVTGQNQPKTREGTLFQWRGRGFKEGATGPQREGPIEKKGTKKDERTPRRGVS